MRYRTWTDEQCIQAIAHSTSIRQVLQKLHLVEAGGNYAQIKKFIREHSLDISHFTDYASNRGRKFPHRHLVSLADIFSNTYPYQSHKLRVRLIADGYYKEECSLCGWNKRRKDGACPLELDHINGNHEDN